MNRTQLPRAVVSDVTCATSSSAQIGVCVQMGTWQ